MKTEKTSKQSATYKQNIYIKGYLGLNSFDLNIDREEMNYLIQEMKKDSKFVCEYLIQKGATIVNQNRYNKASQNLIGKTSNKIDENHYTISQIAKRTSVASSTVSRWIQNGQLKGKRSGNPAIWVVEKEEFEKFIAKRNQEKNQGEKMQNQNLDAKSRRSPKTGISTHVLLHLTQNQKMYQGVFSINEVWKNMDSNYTFEQVNSALLNLSTSKKTKDNFIEKVLGRRGIFKLTDAVGKLEIGCEDRHEDISTPSDIQDNWTKSPNALESKNRQNVKLPERMAIEEYIANQMNIFKNGYLIFSIGDIASKYPNLDRRKISQSINNAKRAESLKDLFYQIKPGTWAYRKDKNIPWEKVLKTPADNTNLENASHSVSEIASIAEIKCVINILKHMDENITIQKAKSILAEKLCEMF